MFTHANNTDSSIGLRRWSTVLSAVLMLSLLAGCDPCMNNPCDDGTACNGIETCTGNGGQAVCSDGMPVTCDTGSTCTEPDGVCVADEVPDPCADVVCDTSDLCNPEACVDGACVAAPIDCDTGDLCVIGECVNGDCVEMPVVCPDGETCDSTTGMCSTTVLTTTTKISDITGVYIGAGKCGDDDDQVTFTSLGGVFMMSGFTGNGDISLALEDDLNATADSVTAFGTAGHALRLTLDPMMGYIRTTLNRPGAFCETDLMKLVP